MPEQTILVAIDVGTTKVSVLIGEVTRNNGPVAIGIAQAPSDGLRKGVATDPASTVHSRSRPRHPAQPPPGHQLQRG